MRALKILTISATLVLIGCSTRTPERLSDEEFMERHHDTPLTPEGITRIIDDRNKREGKKDATDYAQAYAADAVDGMTRLRTLEALDRGDTAKAKRLLMTTMNVDAGFLPVFGTRAQIPAEQQEEARTFAKGYLNYLIAHTNEIQVGRIDFSGCFIGIGELLRDSPSDLMRLTNLMQSLDWPRPHKGSEQRGAANRSQPIRSDTNSISQAAGSSR
jgi:hypothetical protein